MGECEAKGLRNKRRYLSFADSTWKCNGSRLCPAPEGRDVYSLVIPRTSRSNGAQGCLLPMTGGKVHFAPAGARLCKVAGCYKHFAPPEQERIIKVALKI